MSKILVDLPWTLKLELTRGCNISCPFCPIAYKPELSKPKAFMTPKTCEIVTSKYATFKPKTRIELTMRGEPTLNPDLFENISIMRRNLPEAQIMLFTNGVTIKRNSLIVNQLYDAGLDILCLECYEEGDKVKYLKIQQDTDSILTDDRCFNPYKMHSLIQRHRIFCIISDIKDSKETIKVRQIHNNGGNVPEEYMIEKYGSMNRPILPLSKGCARPFREFTVQYDGLVVICCHDWTSQGVIGDLREQGVMCDDIWEGPKHMEFLTHLYNKDRSLHPCNRCDYQGGYRLGFLRNPHTGYSYRDKK